jgi:uncharacterized membrane protein
MPNGTMQEAVWSSEDNRRVATERWSGMLEFIFGAIMYVIVPLSMIALVVLAVILCSESTGDDSAPALAGVLSGFIGFVIYAIGSAATRSSFPSFSPSHPPSFYVIAFAAGVVIGFIVPLVIDVISDTKGIGIATLILTFAGCAGLYSYLFATSTHRFVLYASLSAAFGWLLSGIFFRTEAHKLFLG